MATNSRRTGPALPVPSQKVAEVTLPMAFPFPELLVLPEPICVDPAVRLPASGSIPSTPASRATALGRGAPQAGPEGPACSA